MKPSPNMKAEIEKLAQKHNVPFAQIGEYLHLDMPHFDRLCIEKIGVNRISVAHYFEQNGDLIADPDVELHYPSWVPTGITQAFFGYRTKFIERDGQTFIDTRFHKDVSSFLTLWARNIKAQGWAEGGRVSHE